MNFLGFTESKKLKWNYQVLSYQWKAIIEAKKNNSGFISVILRIYSTKTQNNSSQRQFCTELEAAVLCPT